MDEFLSHQIITTSEIIIVGDLNIHFDMQTNYVLYASTPPNIRGLWCKQYVSEPSHYLGHILDV